MLPLNYCTNIQYGLSRNKSQVFLYFAVLTAYTDKMDDLKRLVADWIRTARKDAGLSQDELGARLSLELGEERGFTKQNISNWENQRHNPSLKHLMGVAKVTGSALPQELSGAASNAAVDDDEVITVQAAARVTLGPELGTAPIRRMKVALSAGITRLEISYDETLGEEIQIPVEVLARSRVSPDRLTALPVKGQSMEPLMFEDDLVVIDTGDVKPVNRELYAVHFDGEACVKQLLYRGGQWYLHSINPDFGPINVRSGELKIIGRVIYQPGRMLTGRL